MAKNPIGFMITDASAGWNEADFDDVFVRKDCFLENGLWLWGIGTSGILGAGFYGNFNRSSPIQTISGGTNWKTVSAGCVSSAGIKTDGTLWVWGSGANGVLGTGNTFCTYGYLAQTVSGGNNWKRIKVDRSAIALKTDGTLWTWGLNSSGNLGTDDTINRSSPVQTISGGTDWKKIAIGVNSYVAGGIKTDGTLWMWGCTVLGNGTLGDDNLIDRSSPVQTVSGGTNWKEIAISRSAVAAIKTDGTLWTWGSNNAGEGGTDNRVSRSSPTQTISGGTNWKQVSGAFQTFAAIKTDGTLWLWGSNACGMAGVDTLAVTLFSSPVQTVSGGTNWREVSLGCFHSTAIKTDGTLWGWGCNISGQLGANDRTFKSSPVQTISGGTNWRTVSAGSSHTIALREDCW
jgi:alpha-tubulin suppressor-like RCC1 family protein